METATQYKSTDPQATLRIGRQQALEKWGSFVSSAESLLKIKGMTLDKLCVALRSAIQFGSLEASLPKQLIEAELKKLAPFTLKDFHGMCADINNWQLASKEKDSEGGPSGLSAPHLRKIAYDNGSEFIYMYDAFWQFYVFGNPLPECPAE